MLAAQEIVNKAMKDTGGDDNRTPNQKRLDEIIDQNEEIIVELQKLNKNVIEHSTIIGQVLIKLTEGKSVASKKKVDKA